MGLFPRGGRHPHPVPAGTGKEGEAVQAVLGPLRPRPHGRGGLRFWGLSVPPHYAGYTRVLWSCLGHLGDRDAPWENKVCTGPSHCRTAADTPESLQACLGRSGDRDAPWENKETETAQTGPEGFGCIRRCVGVVGPCAYLVLPRGVPIPQAAQAGPEGLGCIRRCVGMAGLCGDSHSHTAADTPESLRSCLGRMGDRGAPWEYEETRGLAVPTQRRIHRSPSGPAWAACGIGTPHGAQPRGDFRGPALQRYHGPSPTATSGLAPRRIPGPSPTAILGA